MTKPAVEIRSATAADAAGVHALIVSAHDKYIIRLGRKSTPMITDFAQAIRDNIVHVLEVDGLMVGVLHMITKEAHLEVENVAVRSGWQGRGLGVRLLRRAEVMAERMCYDEVRLHTNEVMTENLRLYKSIGYQEVERRDYKGTDVVYLRKRLPTRLAA